MYIKRSEATIDGTDLEETKTSEARVHEFMRTMPGFRWAMLLSSLETPGRLVSVSMWLSPEQAPGPDASTLGADETHGYDVTTARGSMTPASHVALVDWQVDEGVAAQFTNRWNAAYHAIEERIGSRLLKDLDATGRYTGLHAVTDGANLGPQVLTAELKDAEGLSVAPSVVQRYEVLLLTEA
jgi:heme-degrading monooxygenase HmoA